MPCLPVPADVRASLDRANKDTGGGGGVLDALIIRNVSNVTCTWIWNTYMLYIRDFIVIFVLLYL